MDNGNTTKLTTPFIKRVYTQPFIVVGCIVKNGDKFLLVQEAQVDRGKWNQPAGWLDLGEKITDGARRETEEETGLKVKILGLIGTYTIIKRRNNNLLHAVKIIFAAKPLTSKIKFDKNEVLDAKWFTLAEIKAMKNQLRDADIIKEIENYLAGQIYPLEITSHFKKIT